MPWSSSSFTVSDRAPGPAEVALTVVWLRGAHDASSDGRSAPGARTHYGAVALVLDLSEVEPIAAFDARVIARAREPLGLRSGSLTVRCPSARPRRLIEVCAFTDLLGGEEAYGAKGMALGPWAAVRPGSRAGRQPAGPPRYRSSSPGTPSTWSPGPEGRSGGPPQQVVPSGFMVYPEGGSYHRCPAQRSSLLRG